MPSLEILHPGLMTSIQDLGRKGLAFYAIPQSGVMDQNAARIAWLLLNQNEPTPLIECTSIAPQIKFNDPTHIAITGADFGWTLNDEKINLNTLYTVQKGEILKGRTAIRGLRGYLGIDGILDVDQVYNSYSTYSNARLGGYQGRLLQKGDKLTWTPFYALAPEEITLPICPGPEFDWLSERSKQVLSSGRYRISPDSNRMGIRLQGEPLESTSYQLSFSAPVLPGFLQLPPNGLPIIVLQDGQTTGGYPRIAYIQEQYLSQLNQIPLGSEFRFRLGCV